MSLLYVTYLYLNVIELCENKGTKITKKNIISVVIPHKQSELLFNLQYSVLQRRAVTGRVRVMRTSYELTRIRYNQAELLPFCENPEILFCLHGLHIIPYLIPKF